MRIVSENSDADLARRRALERIEGTLRALTANLLRVTRGAGNAHELGRQAADFIEAVEAHRSSTGTMPMSEEVAAMLDLDQYELLGKLDARERSRLLAEQTVIRGALQVVASRLMEQRTQETAGHHEMFEGINRVEDIREAERAEWGPIPRQNGAMARQRATPATRPDKTAPAKRGPHKKGLEP
jgi:hypothetical protein